jgi:hypothetical protein
MREVDVLEAIGYDVTQDCDSQSTDQTTDEVELVIGILGVGEVIECISSASCHAGNGIGLGRKPVISVTV